LRRRLDQPGWRAASAPGERDCKVDVQTAEAQQVRDQYQQEEEVTVADAEAMAGNPFCFELSAGSDLRKAAHTLEGWQSQSGD